MQPRQTAQTPRVMRANIGEWADPNEPGGYVDDADWAVLDSADPSNLIPDIELSPAQKATFQATGFLPLPGLMIISAEIDPTQRELDWLLDDGHDLKS